MTCSKARGVWLFRILAIGAILALLPVAIQNFRPLMHDFIAYWSTGRVILTGGNPYSPDQMLAIQRANGWVEDWPLMVWYPPWVLPLFIPTGALSYKVGWLVWFSTCLGLIVFNADLLWRFYGGTLKLRWLAWITAILSAYTIFNLVFSQATPLMLTGVTGFLISIRRLNLITSGREDQPKSPVWQLTLLGISLVLISIKPQALYLFWLALGLWVLSRRRWDVLTTGVVAVLVSALIITLLTPKVWEHYIHLLDEFPPDFWATPTLGFLLREIFGQEHFWLQFLAVLPGLAWLAWHWKKSRLAWSWQAEMPVLIAISLMTTTHTWTHDQILLIPAQMQVTARLAGGPLPRGAGWLMSGWAILNVASILLHFQFSDAWFFWQAPAFLGLYAYGLRITSRPFHPFNQS